MSREIHPDYFWAFALLPLNAAEAVADGSMDNVLPITLYFTFDEAVDAALEILRTKLPANMHLVGTINWKGTREYPAYLNAEIAGYGANIYQIQHPRETHHEP